MMKLLLAIALVLGGAVTKNDAQETCPSSRICSTLGFSFEPPAASGWKTEFGRNAIQFSRALDPKVVSMHAGAMEGNISESPRGPDELVALVRKLKSKWGTDARYVNVKEAYAVEAEHVSCVRYTQSAEDTGANNRGQHLFMLMQSVGRFCLHPKQRMHAIDLYYSIRSVPGYSTADLEREGEVLLRSLTFTEP